jgi:hypothetical protein
MCSDGVRAPLPLRGGRVPLRKRGDQVPTCGSNLQHADSMRRESPEPTVDRRSIANFRYQLCRRWLRYCLGLMSRP